jgi:hypothetical protein
MHLVIGLVHDRASGSHNIHPHLERFAEARPNRTQNVAAARRATIEVMNSRADEGNESASGLPMIATPGDAMVVVDDAVGITATNAKVLKVVRIHLLVVTSSQGTVRPYVER